MNYAGATMETENFAIFITTHGRPDSVKTYTTLRRCGYTGRIYLIIDNEDKTAYRYKELYGDQVIVFDKAEAAKTVDTGDNFPGRGAVVFARNACFDIAEDLGIDWFVQMDDDYTNMKFMFNHLRQFQHIPIKNIDIVFDLFVRYFSSIEADCISFAQGGDFIGGGDGYYAKTIGTKRKVMNVFFLSPSRRFDFFGRMNDDVNAYLYHGMRGRLMFTILQVGIVQELTQAKGGGMTDLYKDSGTYRKTFYSVMYTPSCVKVSMTGESHRRIHHRISWNNAVPCIVGEEYRK